MVRIKSVESIPLAEKVAEELRAVIERESLKPGDPFPGELELSSRLGVSRNVVREALGRLRMQGIVDTRKRRGMLVGSPKPFGSLRGSLVRRLLSPEDRRDLIQMRVMLELGMVDYVCANVSDADIEDLRRIAAEEAQLTPCMPEQIAKEMEFHLRLYRITGNRNLAELQELLSQFFAETTSWPTDAKGKAKPCPQGKRDFRHHIHIVDALATRDPKQLSDALRQHFSAYLASAKR